MKARGWASRMPGVIGALAFTLVALVGCAIESPGEPALTASQARTQFYSTLDETQDAAGGTWVDYDDPTPRSCVVPLWIEGRQYPGLRIAGSPADPAAAANAVYTTWRSWGYEVDRSRIGTVIQLQVHFPSDQLLTFRVSSLSMTLQGSSECRPLGE